MAYNINNNEFKYNNTPSPRASAWLIPYPIEPLCSNSNEAFDADILHTDTS